MAFRKLDRELAQLVIVDVQERMLPHICEHDQVTQQIVRILRAARELNIPVTFTEQYPQGLGRTVAAIAEHVGKSPVMVKSTFSIWGESEIRERLTGFRRPQMLLAGVEAHICVQHSALDLVKEQFRPVVLVDAVGSRRTIDRDTALERMRTQDIDLTTVEAAIFEMLDRSGDELFKRILPIVK